MQAHRKLYRHLGLILIFFFLQGQSCDPIFFSIFGIDNPYPVNCSEVQILSLEQTENGDVSMSWNQLGEDYRVSLYYQGNALESYIYTYPVHSANFHIDWQSLQGPSNEVIVELSVDSFYTPNSCIVTRSIERPSLPIVVTSPMNCVNLNLTSPLGGMANGLETFYWDALEGAVNYRINIYENNESPAPLIGLDAGNVTTLSIDVSVNAIGGETPLVVELLANDGAGNACSKRYEIAREAAAPQSVPPTATPTCAQDPSASYC